MNNRDVYQYFMNMKQEDKISYSKQVGNKCDEIIVEHGADFFETLSYCIKNNYPILRCDIPVKLRIGFIAIHNGDNLHYTLGLFAFKEWVKNNL